MFPWLVSGHAPLCSELAEVLPRQWEAHQGRPCVEALLRAWETPHPGAEAGSGPALHFAGVLPLGHQALGWESKGQAAWVKSRVYS